MSDLTICSTWQPTAWAASLAVRVESDNSTTSQPNPRCCKIACTLRALALNSCGILRSLSHLVHMNVFCDGLPAAAQARRHFPTPGMLSTAHAAVPFDNRLAN